MMTATVTEINSLINEIKGVQFRIEKWEAIASFFRILEGEDVEEGQTIGTVGNSASFEVADDYHLHFELIKDGEYLNPCNLIEF